MSDQYMQDLPKGARFVWHDHNLYEVATPACEHPDGHVPVSNLTTGIPGVFAYTSPVPVTVVVTR